ncbi:D-glycero-beta-D-manno-heptose 1-phosphate adenylyltransferase [Pelistega europaea]|uniref:D-glycero-beta-D-manno-heptose 1-phosphate adenylyltransferase n=1 Tax=Pelistega europaea TaxID=106147 RepID=A0A7Y4LBB8_9BURK|nr:D-glycero-beta-D-manno-heptose 1-phosphate adenylyltransferase [Pelistega europaea]NOL49166.1 D-glycero-beta-D-manno-heptose 1-phosphate adenylyltransferase [Pelistega europaea]
MAQFEQKILSPDEIAEKLRNGELPRPCIFTNGVFDILHRGHVTYLEAARQLGACLVVGVNTDASVKRLGKAPDRPFNTLEDRQALLAALASTDAVTFFDEDTPYELIAKLRPDMIVKGGDYDMSKLPETALVHQWGGKAVAIDFEHDRSTTALVKKIKA